MPEEKKIYHLYAPQDETADTEADRAIKDAKGNIIDETYFTAEQAQEDFATKEYVDENFATKSNVNNHIADESNPHKVTKSQVGLSNVDNTSDLDKPISTAQATEFAKYVTLDTEQTLTAEKTFIKNGAILTVQSEYAQAHDRFNLKVSAYQSDENIEFRSCGDIYFAPHVGSSASFRMNIWHFSPTSTNLYDLGDNNSALHCWRNLYLSGNITDGTNSISVAQMVTKQDALTTGNNIAISNNKISASNCFSYIPTSKHFTNINGRWPIILATYTNWDLVAINNMFGKSYSLTEDVDERLIYIRNETTYVPEPYPTYYTYGYPTVAHITISNGSYAIIINDGLDDLSKFMVTNNLVMSNDYVIYRCTRGCDMTWTVTKDVGYPDVETSYGSAFDPIFDLEKKLISGTNIKTIDDESILGAGNMNLSSRMRIINVDKYDSSTFPQIDSLPYAFALHVNNYPSDNSSRTFIGVKGGGKYAYVTIALMNDEETYVKSGSGVGSSSLYDVINSQNKQTQTKLYKHCISNGMFELQIINARRFEYGTSYSSGTYYLSGTKVEDIIADAISTKLKYISSGKTETLFALSVGDQNELNADVFDTANHQFGGGEIADDNSWSSFVDTVTQI